ncbi:hypothetical protein GO013_14940 [Pseudodesulfovibrio sp. JC047]|nr:hypothetical protein [Pseudodesulfovibrio sp. JC047]
MIYVSHFKKRTPQQRLFRCVLGTVIIGCLVWAFYSIPYDILREERARLFGEELTSGLVLAVSSDNAVDMPDTRLLVEYKYVDPDGFARVTTARLPNSLWTRYRPGSTIQVIFVRTRPDLVRVPDEVEPAFQVWLRELMN